MTDHIAENWPHLAALITTLDALDQRQTTVAHPGKAEEEQFNRFIAKLNRTGSPKISPRAIAS